jgi:TPP-dependent pyruvate/acetoin dehydrogenase alpha subunit
MMEHDTIKHLRATALQQGLGAAQDFDAVDVRINQMIEDAVAYADRSPYPALSEVDTDVYAVAVS